MDNFEVKIKLGETVYPFQVYPGTDSTFTIGVDAVDVGILKKIAEIDQWEWLEGGNTFDPNVIGNKIDCYYE